MIHSLTGAAKLFAQPQDGFDSRRIEQMANSALKETLMANARRAEEQWAEEHKMGMIQFIWNNVLGGIKCVDEDELAFLDKIEDARRLKILEREIADLSELEKYHVFISCILLIVLQQEIKSKVYNNTITTASLLEPAVVPTKLDNKPAANPVVQVAKTAVTTQKKTATVKIVPTKRKQESEEKSKETDSKNKNNNNENASKKIKTEKEENTKQEVKKESKKPKIEKAETKKPKKEEGNSLLGLADYGDDSD